MCALDGRSWVIAYARVVFPQPLSPTSPTVSPRSMDRFTPSTARTHPWRSGSKRAGPGRRREARSAPPEARVDDLVETASQQVKAEAQEGDRQARREEPPPVRQRATLCEDVRQDPAPRDDRRIPEAEETQRRLRDDCARDGEAHVQEAEREHIRRDVQEDQTQIGRTGDAGRIDERTFLQGEDLRPDDPRDAGPSEETEDHDDRPDAGTQDGIQD